MLITSAPWVMAKSIPVAMSSVSPPSFLCLPLIGRIFAWGAIPRAPAFLSLPCAAMSPAMPVPWPSESSRPSLYSPYKVSIPGRRFLRKSGWGSTPVSRTATVTPAPLDNSCALSTLRYCRCHCFSRIWPSSVKLGAANAGAAALDAIVPRVSTVRVANVSLLTYRIQWLALDQWAPCSRVGGQWAAPLRRSPTGGPDPTGAVHVLHGMRGTSGCEWLPKFPETVSLR